MCVCALIYNQLEWKAGDIVFLPMFTVGRPCLVDQVGFLECPQEGSRTRQALPSPHVAFPSTSSCPRIWLRLIEIGGESDTQRVPILGLLDADCH